MTKEEKAGQFIGEMLSAAPLFKRRVIMPIGAGKLSGHQLFCFMTMVKDGKRSMSELARELGVSATQITRIVNGLVESGMAERSADPNNRRVVLVCASPAGKELFFKHHEEAKSDAVARLCKLSEEDLDAAIEHIRALKEILGRNL